MDVRLSSEQQALRDAAAKVVADLGPGTVGGLDDAERAAKLDAAVAASGWRELRADAGDGRPWASGVEVAIVAEELGRAAADTPFLGPTLAADLRRRAGVAATVAPETVLFAADLTRLATTDDLASHGADEAPSTVAVDAAGASSALVLEPAEGGWRLASVTLGASTVRVDLTRPAAGPASAPTTLDGQTTVLTTDDLDAVAALGLALGCADQVGGMQGGVDLAAGYAAERRQYGQPVGSFQAVQHLLADALVLTEGSRSAARHAAWAVDALTPADARTAASVAAAYAGRASRTVGEIAIQVHGGIGNTWECLAHVFLRRGLLSTELFGGVDAHLRRVDEFWPGITPARSYDPGPEIVREGMDFGDSPEEAEFRARLRAWLVENNPGLPSSSTSDDYWAGAAAWHQSLFDAGFFALSWPESVGGQARSTVYEVILDEEISAAGAPPRPSLGYLVQGILEHGSADIQARFLPPLVNGRERWCQGFSEPDAGSDLASLRTRAELDPATDEYVITGHKIWTSYSDVADWCLVLARTDPEVAKHKGLSAFAVPMDQPGIEQHPITMINGITSEFGEVLFDGARVPAANMIGGPGEGWRLAMTVVSHEREPGELGYVARYQKTVASLHKRAQADPTAVTAEARRDLTWAIIETEMLRLHVCRRLSDRLDGITHGPEGSIDKLLMTATEQTVGHAALSVGGAGHAGGDDTPLKTYLYSRAQSVMGGTAQIQRNLIATRILGLPTS